MARRGGRVLNRAQQDLEWRRCLNDFRYFCQNYWFVDTPAASKSLEADGAYVDASALEEASVSRFEFFPWQDELADAMERESKILLLKARQIGFSTIITARVVWVACRYPNSEVLVASKDDDAAKRLVLKARLIGIKNLPEWMQKRVGVNNRESSAIRFDNGSVVESTTVRGEPGRGMTLRLLVLDEWAYAQDPSQAWQAAQPAFEDAGQVIAGSSAKGGAVAFQDQWEAAKPGLEGRSESGFFRMFASWRSKPGRDNEWRDSVFSAADDKVAKANEYPETPEEAFAAATLHVFDQVRLMSLDVFAGTRGRLIGNREDKYWQFVPPVPDDKFRFEVFKFPEAGKFYVCGVDTAGHQDWGDYTAMCVFSEDWDLCAVWHGNGTVSELTQHVWAVSSWYSDALTVVETNGVGDALLGELSVTGHPNLYHEQRRTAPGAGQKMVAKAGFAMTTNKKLALIETLAQVLKVEGLSLPDAELLRELKAYQFLNVERKQAGAPPGRHDDLVTATMLAAYVNYEADWDSAMSPGNRLAEMSPGYGNLAAWLRRRQEQDATRIKTGHASGGFAEQLAEVRSWQGSISGATGAVMSGRNRSGSEPTPLPFANAAGSKPRNFSGSL